MWVSFFSPLSLYLVNQIEFSNQGLCEVLEIDSQTLLNACLQDYYSVIGQIGNFRYISYLGNSQNFVLLTKIVARRLRLTYMWLLHPQKTFIVQRSRDAPLDRMHTPRVISTKVGCLSQQPKVWNEHKLIIPIRKWEIEKH